MSDTPRSDGAELLAIYSATDARPTGKVDLLLAQTLERELAAEKAKTAAALSIAEDALKDMERCRNSVVESTVLLPNVGEYIKQIEAQLAEANRRLDSSKDEFNRVNSMYAELVVECGNLRLEAIAMNRKLELETGALKFISTPLANDLDGADMACQAQAVLREIEVTQ